MSEIRDRVKHEMMNAVQRLMEATEAFERGDISWEEAALYTQAYPEEILSIPEIAIVDREAELPQKPMSLGANLPHREQLNCFNHWQIAQQGMLKAGWVKEVTMTKEEILAMEAGGTRCF